MFIPKHLDKFKASFPAPIPLASNDEREGRRPADWFKGVDRNILDVLIGDLPQAVNRGELLSMATNRAIGTAELCISIFAWGGMHGANRARLFEKPLSPWLKVADRVRDGSLSRADAFDAFTTLDSENGSSAIPGMGPAYFTKLLYFLAPGLPIAPKGYIMDQWVGCSINLLTGQRLAKLDHHVTWTRGSTTPQINSIVSRANSGREYEVFCLAVESLAREMGPAWTPELAERALIADGGRRRHTWRVYVVEERRRLLCQL